MQNNDITYCRAITDDELHQILNLQKQNLPNSLLSSEIEQEGFVTVIHTFDILKQMNDCCPHVIAKYNKHVVAYALCMHPKFANEIEVLKPMFIEINNIVSPDLKYMAMGQICVDKSYRKIGIFRGLYNFMKQELKSTFDTIITEVDAKNMRSLNAHLAVGFENLREYKTSDKHWFILSLNCCG